jgi:hypothetical protein
VWYGVGEALLGALVAVIGWRLNKSGEARGQTVDRIELLVNGRMDAALVRITELEGKLTEHGVAIPPGAPSVAPASTPR